MGSGSMLEGAQDGDEFSTCNGVGLGDTPCADQVSAIGGRVIEGSTKLIRATRIRNPARAICIVGDMFSPSGAEGRGETGGQVREGGRGHGDSGSSYYRGY